MIVHRVNVKVAEWRFCCFVLSYAGSVGSVELRLLCVDEVIQPVTVAT